jgi:hypothetical protein
MSVKNQNRSYTMAKRRSLRSGVVSAAPKFIPEIYRRCGTAFNAEVRDLIGGALFTPIFNGNNSMRIMVQNFIYDMEETLGGFKPYDS